MKKKEETEKAPRGFLAKPDLTIQAYKEITEVLRENYIRDAVEAARKNYIKKAIKFVKKAALL